MRFRPFTVIISWALYDLANQFFVLNVVTLYFPTWLTIVNKAPEILYSISFGFSMICIALLSPILGVLADQGGKRKSFLVYFTLLSIVFTMLLGTTTNIYVALIFFAVANFGCQAGIVFYNALMVDVAPTGKIGLISGFGRMCGYIGAIVALYISKPVLENMGYQATFVLTGILFLIFALPCMIILKDKEKGSIVSCVMKRSLWTHAFTELKETVTKSHKFPELRNFFKAAFFALCVVHAIILFMAVYAAQVFKLDTTQLVHFIAFSTLFAILGSIISGFVCDKIGYKKSLLIIYSVWIVALFLGGVTYAPFHWVIGALVGLSLGATWVVFRALVVELVPQSNLGEAFGLFNLVSYCAGIVGPLCWGFIRLVGSRYGDWGTRAACLSMIVFLVVAIAYLMKVKEPLKTRKVSS